MKWLIKYKSEGCGDHLCECTVEADGPVMAAGSILHGDIISIERVSEYSRFPGDPHLGDLWQTDKDFGDVKDGWFLVQYFHDGDKIIYQYIYRGNKKDVDRDPLKPPRKKQTFAEWSGKSNWRICPPPSIELVITWMESQL